MNMTYVYMGIVVGALLILAMLAYATVKSGRPNRLTPLAALASWMNRAFRAGSRVPVARRDLTLGRDTTGCTQQALS